MPTITFEGQEYFCAGDETILECMTRHGVLLPSSCQSGACQSCMIRALEGTPPPESQSGLKDTLKQQNFFLACICKPTGDMSIGLSSVSPRKTVKVTEKELLNESVVRLRLERPSGFSYRAGQFINLLRPSDELTRSYSLASIESDDFLELHIKRVPEGKMSNWVFDELQLGDDVVFFGPAGDCFYISGRIEQPLLLVGTGTGLAPLYGILRDVFSHRHTGPIHLFHASLATAGLYLEQTLRDLHAEHANLTYTPVVLHGEPPEGGLQGNLVDIPSHVLGSLSGYRVFICGDPAIVNALRQKCFLAGASMQDIYSDPFVFSPHD
ncbi:MAG: oxygenase [Zetaproteobacteria bacterium CG12_big_fil_rev_8_21_14_0_65_55_1124]|nr:MAG: oxygenase [Zetaproteobacteria bacterium CG1_02_55_237]PIS20289.1 MAG: oxygenase [Zetaproteobacteria bacterium CG08_land_8_20_14_0_20_55_17]PIW43165.1 MAG: oxygenase [Zetaproteobacteria bacterium CG12_big_fil_rev_8_21_14_0_65_55_1124]PIY52129.1 MAG: oxygenase [Zetaproteobacteria bacterium CG_4_10_14_0_8_um_filter_55_43]PIZ38142.1 MAG: oxygenase [Zetaproteobacteria bacterium CG_4_10_14_0_2_um_filter_55_20]PJB79505.1 MAG: oxygenase [Zetaproteobacteria bacterium CG_4_9_14_0_8_um_filter_55_